MLQAEAMSGLPEDRCYADFFNLIHSPEGWMVGIRLAVWLDRAPARLPKTPDVLEPPLATLGWMDGAGRPKQAWLPLTMLDANVRILDRAQYVALAYPDLEPTAPQAWKKLLEIGYAPTLSGQIAGWVFERPEEARGPLPGYRTDAALLPQRGADALSEPCLLLVEVNYAWCVLSEPGANTYSHGSALNRGAEVLFRPESELKKLWAIRKQGVVEPRRLAALFGDAVAPSRVDMTSQTRARPDAPSLLVSVRETE